jgi:glucose-1-phosphate thymidylyltransferase
MKGLILAGGHGTRLRPLTFTGNKHMIPIANKPMLLHGMDHLIDAGVKEIGIILGPIKEGVRDTVGNGSKFGVNITYIDQPDPKGLAHAVLISEDFIKGEPFIMYLGDNLIKQGVKPLIYSYFNEASDCVICVSAVNNPAQYGIVELDSKGNLSRLVEKPKDPKSNLALAGVYLFNSSIFEAVKSISPSWRNELEITDAIQYLLEKGKKITYQKIEGWWKDTGRPDDLLEANHLLLDDLDSACIGKVHASSKILGKVSVGKNTVIREDTRIKGPVIIGENCEIGPHVYIGPYAAIGDNVKVLSGEIEGSIIMQDAIINCNKRIIDSIIGKHSRLESGDNLRPSGARFVLGENTLCRI